MDKLYIVPGFGESTQDSSYKKIIKEAKNAGFSPVPVDINWERTSVSQWVDEFLQKSKLNKETATNSLAMGFSFGAMILLLAAQRIRFKKLILCSPSPFFKEDISIIPNAVKKTLGKRRIEDFSRHPFRALPIPAVFMMGDSDWSIGIERLLQRYKIWRHKKELILIPGVGHDIGNPLYQEKIIEILSSKKENPR